MSLFIYTPIHKIVLGYAQERICQYLKEHDEAKGIELYELSSKQSKPTKQLLKYGIIFKNEKGRYQLRKEVQHFNDGISSWISTMEELEEFKKRCEKHADWCVDIEEVPSPIKEELLEKGYYLERVKDEVYMTASGLVENVILQ